MRFRSKIILATFFTSAILLVGGVLTPVAHAAESGSNLTEYEARSQGLGAEQSALNLIECGGFWDKLTISCIMPQLAYYLLYLPAVGLLTASGYIFDFVISLSIDKAFIDRPFVETAWGVIRDFSNMVFIFILLYTGIRTMFGLGKWQRTIIDIVIIALIINFSLFFSKVIIDAGNMLAVGVYSGMGAEKQPIDRPHKTGGDPNAKERNISASLIAGFAPQQFMDLAATENKSFAVLIFLIAAIVSAYIAWVFLKASLMLVGRIIAFWFYMIISPFALISIVIPKWNMFDSWLYGLINQAVVAPVFLFFVYLIMFAVGGGGTGILGEFGKLSETGSFFDTIVISVVVTGMIIYAMQYALKVAKGLAGDFGNIGAKAATTVLSSFPVGMAAGVAFGGAGVLGRTVIGGAAAQLLKSERLKEMQGAKSPWYSRYAGRFAQKQLEGVQGASFDVRGTEVFKEGLKTIKSELGVGISVGKAGGKGGYKKEQEEFIKKAQKEAEKLNMSKEAEKVVEEKHNISAFEEAVKAATSVKEAAISVKEATENLKKAQDISAGTVTGIRVENAQKGIKDARSNAARFAGDILAKKIKDLEARKARTEDLTQRVAIDREIDQMNQGAEQAGETLKRAEEELQSARAAHLQTAEGQALIAAEEAKKSSEEATKVLEDATKNLKEAKEDAKKEIEAINASRREQYGKDVSWKSIYTYREDVKKIKDGISKDKKKQEEAVKMFVKFAEEGKEKKEGGGEEGGGEKK